MSVINQFKVGEKVPENGKYQCMSCFWIKYFVVNKNFDRCPKCGSCEWRKIS